MCNCTITERCSAKITRDSDRVIQIDFHSLEMRVDKRTLCCVKNIFEQMGFCVGTGRAAITCFRKSSVQVVPLKGIVRHFEM